MEPLDSDLEEGELELPANERGTGALQPGYDLLVQGVGFPIGRYAERLPKRVAQAPEQWLMLHAVWLEDQGNGK